MELENNVEVISPIEVMVRNDSVVKKTLEGIIERKKGKEKEKTRELGRITKEILESEAVVFNDESVTFQELIAARAVANSVKNSEIGMKELQDIQRVTGESMEQQAGVTIVINTGGQDLGD